MAAAVAIPLTPACSTGLESLPLPAPALNTTSYALNVVFANALNLPARAHVKLAGADIGELESISAKGYTAHTTLRIRAGIRIPVGTTAELRSATPLGDVFVSLKPPASAADDAPLLGDGATIGLESTTSASTVEAVLSSAAVLVNGGAVRNMTKLTNSLGKAAGGNGAAFADILRKSNQLLTAMNSRSGQFEAALSESNQLAKILTASQDQITDILAAGAPATEALADNTGQAAEMIGQLSGITRQLSRFPSIQGTDTRSILADVNTISDKFNQVATHPDPLLWGINRLLPPFIKTAQGTAIPGQIDVMKIALGSIPDIGYPGDPGFHGPKRADWDAMIGSFRYSLLRLQERVVGAGPK